MRYTAKELAVLFERSKDDREMIVGSEVRLLIGMAQDSLEKTQEVADYQRRLQEQIDDKHRILREYEAKVQALQTTRPEALRIPDGWKLVPTKVTDAMLDGWFETRGGSDCGDVTEFQPRYAAMIAAAPSAPSPLGTK